MSILHYLILLGAFGHIGPAANRFLQTSTSSPIKNIQLGCTTTIQSETHITCDYADAASQVSSSPRLILNHVEVIFGSLKKGERGDLSFKVSLTNSGSAVLPLRQVYFQIDGDDGRNYIRRVLPSFDIAKIAPGAERTFSEEIDVGFFQIGHYTIHIWIPDSDPKLKFDPAHNLLFANAGVGDTQTGLNTIADFTITVPPPPRRVPRPSN